MARLERQVSKLQKESEHPAHRGPAPRGLEGVGVVRGFDSDMVFHDGGLKTVCQPLALGRNVPGE